MISGPGRGEKRSGEAIRVDLLEPADAAVADEFASNAELTAIFRSLLRARLVDTTMAIAGFQQVASLAHRDGDGFLAVDILPARRAIVAIGPAQ